MNQQRGLSGSHLDEIRRKHTRKVYLQVHKWNKLGESEPAKRFNMSVSG